MRTLVHFACEATLLTHRVCFDVNLIVGESGLVILDFEVLAQHLDLLMVGKDDHSVAVLYHPDLAKRPNVRIQSEGSPGPEAVSHQVTQNLD